MMARLGYRTHSVPGRPAHYSTSGRMTMTWSKPEAEIVAVTMEVTAYVATL
jgi:coenzyme PQQ precursor peptide PqqA